MTESQRFVSATGVELSLSPRDTWKRIPRLETFAMAHGCWRDLVIPLEKEYSGVEPWRWFERGWVVSLFKLKARQWRWKEMVRLPRQPMMRIDELVEMVDDGKVAAEESVTFDVFEVSPGVLHVEIRDDFEGWTAREILELPGKLWVGRTSRRESDYSDDEDLSAFRTLSFRTQFKVPYLLDGLGAMDELVTMAQASAVGDSLWDEGDPFDEPDFYIGQ